MKVDCVAALAWTAPERLGFDRRINSSPWIAGLGLAALVLICTSRARFSIPLGVTRHVMPE